MNEPQPSSSSFGRTALAVLIVLLAGWFLLHFVVHLVVWLATLVAIVVAVIALVWALRVLL